MARLTSIFLILSFNYLAFANCLAEPDKYNLEQLQVLFRHGDRTPTEYDVYEGDPYGEIYRQYGYGHLTKVGKNREYKIGRVLRKRYDAFLGDYQYDEVYAYSTDIDRTKMSLQLVLAGLYPPAQSQSWSDSVNWQPIPTHYDALNVGFLSRAYFTCPRFRELYAEVAERPEMLKVFREHRALLQKVENSTNTTIEQLFDPMPIYSNLRSALSLGLPLPAWSTAEDYRELEKIASLGFKAMVYTEQLRRMFAGPVVERLLKILKDDGGKRKIYLYGGHEFNVAAFINSHNITEAPAVADYGSAVVLEKLRGPDDRHYVRVYLWTGVAETFLPLKITNCERTCPLDDYEKIAQAILPNEASRVCTPSEVSRAE